MLPGVAEVVLVAEAPDPLEDPEHRHGLLIQLILGIAIDVGAIGSVPDPEIVEVIVPPAKGGLDHEVQLVQANTARHKEAPPDRRVDVSQGDPDLEDRLAGWGGHPSRLRRQ